MPVDLSRMMVTDSTLQLLLVRYACICQRWPELVLRVSSGGYGGKTEVWMECGRMDTYVGLGEVRVKPKEDNMRARVAGDEPLLVVRASATLVGAVILVVAALFVVLAAVVVGIVPTLGLIIALI